MRLRGPLVCLLLALVLAAPAGAAMLSKAPADSLPIVPAPAPAGGAIAADGDGIVSEPNDIESFDGTVLSAVLWHNESHAASPRPVVLAAHGWAGEKGSQEGTARWLAGLGYVVLAWDARGFGESGGTVGLNGPDEWGDVSAILDWLAARAGDEPRLLLDAPGDPRAGMVGGSYGGGIQLLAAAHDERIDAITPEITWHDLVTSLAPNGVVKRGWVDLLYWSGQGASHGLTTLNANLGGMEPRFTEWYLEAWATGRIPADAVPYLLERSPVMHNDQLTAHTLLIQGWRDTLFWPDEATRNHAELAARAGAEIHLLFHRAGHGNSLNEEDREVVRGYMELFFARHLLDEDIEPMPVVVYQDGASGGWLENETWPPAGTAGMSYEVKADGGTLSFDLLQIPAPTSHTELQQFAGQAPLPHLDLAPGLTSVVLETGAVGPLVLAGRPVVSFAVVPAVDDLVLFVSLVETGDGLFDTVLYNQVLPIRIEGKAGQSVPLTLELASLAHSVPAGSEIRLRIATSDLAYLGAREPGMVTVRLDEASLALPLAAPPGVEVQPVIELVEEAVVPAVGWVLVVAIVGVFARWRRNL